MLPTWPASGCVCDVLYKSDGVAHIAVEDYDYDVEDHEDEEMFEEGLVISIPEPNDAPAFNLERECAQKSAKSG